MPILLPNLPTVSSEFGYTCGMVTIKVNHGQRVVSRLVANYASKRFVLSERMSDFQQIAQGATLVRFFGSKDGHGSPDV